MLFHLHIFLCIISSLMEVDLQNRCILKPQVQKQLYRTNVLISWSSFRLVVLGFSSTAIRSSGTSQLSSNLPKTRTKHSILCNFFKCFTLPKHLKERVMPQLVKACSPRRAAQYSACLLMFCIFFLSESLEECRDKLVILSSEAKKTGAEANEAFIVSSWD